MKLYSRFPAFRACTSTTFNVNCCLCCCKKNWNETTVEGRKRKMDLMHRFEVSLACKSNVIVKLLCFTVQVFKSCRNLSIPRLLRIVRNLLFEECTNQILRIVVITNLVFLILLSFDKGYFFFTSTGTRRKYTINTHRWSTDEARGCF